jgi:CRP/FNR family transcriptional regulator, cyclic AMP receptor protein
VSARRGLALLDADPDFRHAMPADEEAAARRLVVVPRLDLAPGPWAPPGGAPAWGAVVIAGVLVHDLPAGDRIATQLIGPGDVIDPWAAGEASPATARWSVLRDPVTLAVLDAGFGRAVRRWPGLAAVAHRKLADRAERLAAHAAILQLPAVDDRIMGVLWELAERFGRVRPDGVVVPLRLTHQQLGQLVGAQRPTVSLALRALVATGRVSRTDAGGWLLAGATQALAA